MSDDATIAPGCRAILYGLQAKAVLNGLEVHILSWVAAKERWAVQLTSKDATGITVKQHNLARAPDPFRLLNEDALMHVLVRAVAATHKPLIATCARFRSGIQHPSFLSLRVKFGFAEASVVIDPKERYDEEDETTTSSISYGR